MTKYQSQPRFLLLDAGQGGGLEAASSEILRRAFGAGAQIQKHPVGIGEPSSGETHLRALVADFKPDLIFLILASGLLAQSGEVFRVLRETTSRPIVAVSDALGADEIFGLLKLGVNDFTTRPVRESDLLPRIWRLIEQSAAERSLTQSLKEKLGLRQLIGECQAFTKEIRKIPLVAKCDASVLISGETGTGKEVCGRSVHYLSPRARRPFVPVNCGAIPVELVENELFGHERGAYTGATTSKPGLIHEADGGTLFLDEVDCLPMLAQVKLLRFLQEKEYRPLGSTKTLKADVRIIAATNVNFEEAVKAGKLRRDLYYRLNVIPLVLPPLRERRGDVLLLARHFLAKYKEEFDKRVGDFSAEARGLLLSYDWPGNVRELENVVERAVVLCEGETICGADIALSPAAETPPRESFQEAKHRMVEQFEKSYIEGLLHTHQGNITRAAEAARKNRRAFWQLIRKNKIDVKTFKAGRA